MKNTGERAGELFGSGMNCAESVLTAAMERAGVAGTWFPRVASGFGSGVARRGVLCGAVSGAVMALGVSMGRNGPGEDIGPLYTAASELFDAFLEEFGSTVCADLVGIDLSDPAEVVEARKKGLFAQRCTPLVVFCGNWLQLKSG